MLLDHLGGLPIEEALPALLALTAAALPWWAAAGVALARRLQPGRSGAGRQSEGRDRKE